MQPKKLEEYKYFRPIAWTTIVLFAVFVYSLSLKLQTVAEDLRTTNLSMEERVQNLEDVVYKNE